MDAHGRVEHAAQQLPRRRPPQPLLDGVRERERVQRGVPVGVLVAGREASDPRRRREGDRRGELDRAGAVVERREQRVEDLRRLAAEDDLHQLLPAAPLTRRPWLRQARERVLEQRDQVDRVAPGVRLLHPLGERELRRQRGEHRLRALPAGDVERLERLVDEVERVAAVEVAVVGRGREEHVGELLGRRARADGRDERALGALRVAHLDEAAEPAREPRGLDRVAGQRLEREARRLASGVGGHVGKAVVERGRPLVGLEPGHEVHQARQRRQAAEPAAAAPRDAEVEPGPERVDPARVGLLEHDRRLRDHQRDVALEADLQPRALVLDRVAPRRHVDVDLAVLDLDREAAQLVGPLVEGAAGAEVEARVVPVAGEDAVGQRAAVEREAHVRAAVVDRVHLALVGEQADRVALDADDEPALGLELLERGGSLALRGLHDSHRPAP